MNLIIPPPATGTARPVSRPAAALRAAGQVPARIGHGRPSVLAGRTLAAVIPVEAVLHCGAGAAATVGTLTGVLTWYLVTVRADLSPPSDGVP